MKKFTSQQLLSEIEYAGRDHVLRLISDTSIRFCKSMYSASQHSDKLEDLEFLLKFYREKYL
jgi:hypothetical protein